MNSEKEIDRFHTQLADRFGETPTEVDNLFNVVKIRNLGGSLGFEKIIIKNGMFICFFLSNALSPYYKSEQFAGLLVKIGNDSPFTLKQTDGKLKIITRGIDSTEAALRTLKKLQ